MSYKTVVQLVVLGFVLAISLAWNHTNPAAIEPKISILLAVDSILSKLGGGV